MVSIPWGSNPLILNLDPSTSVPGHPSTCHSLFLLKVLARRSRPVVGPLVKVSTTRCLSPSQVQPIRWGQISSRPSLHEVFTLNGGDCKGNPLILGKPRLVKYYNLERLRWGRTFPHQISPRGLSRRLCPKNCEVSGAGDFWNPRWWQLKDFFDFSSLLLGEMESNLTKS